MSAMKSTVTKSVPQASVSLWIALLASAGCSEGAKENPTASSEPQKNDTKNVVSNIDTTQNKELMNLTVSENESCESFTDGTLSYSAAASNVFLCSKRI